MCGIIAIFNPRSAAVAEGELSRYLEQQRWRGPDHTGVWMDEGKRAFLGHNRLTILDESPDANMPMKSSCGRYVIVYNGEIYNHEALRVSHGLACRTHSDTETLVNLYAKIGGKCVEQLEGMFAFVIFDTVSGEVFAARDQLGIKPLYYSDSAKGLIFGSEPAVIAKMIDASPSQTAIKEWKVFRRPIGGRTFFENVSEIPPGCRYECSGRISRYWKPSKCEAPLTLEKFECALEEAVKSHLINDFQTVSLLSGGIDSAVILALSGIKKAYTVGLTDNNEFDDAEESGNVLGAKVEKVKLTADDLRESWKCLIRARQEPLSVPNEGLIYSVCLAMRQEEKVVLTGEGADELLFGYDRIFRWAAGLEEVTVQSFLGRYSYSSEVNGLDRESVDLLEEMKLGKTPLDFVEDFFIEVHLPGLLRRMDGASMCASKEARVPFVTSKLFNLVYRQPLDARYYNGHPKGPLRTMAENHGLFGAVNRKKIGFSASINGASQRQEYEDFQEFCLKELGWN